MADFLVYYTVTGQYALPVKAASQEEAEAMAKAIIENEEKPASRIDVDGWFDLDFTEKMDD